MLALDPARTPFAWRTSVWGVLTLTFAAGTAAVGAGQDALPPAKLKAIKAATVLIQLSHKMGSGSGFVARVEGKTVYVVTNHHVIDDALPADGEVAPPKAPLHKAMVVFHSGTADERTVESEVIADDPRYDLAVLRVSDVTDPPAPIDLTARAELSETTPVLVCGFPFGTALAGGAKNPAVTIGKAFVSSVRQSPTGKGAAVQLDGAVNPGNSGGPVVTPDGALVGVAVAAIRGAGIGFAVSRTCLDEVLRGRVIASAARATQDAPGGKKVRVSADVVDPFRKIRAARLYTREARYGDPMPVKRDGAGDWPRMSPAVRHELKDWGLTASVTLTRATVRRPLWVQVEYELEDGTTVREAPEELTPAPVEKPAAPAEPEFVDLPPPIVLGGRVRVRTALPTLPPIPPDGATMTDLAKTPGKFPSGKPVVVHALLQSKSVNYRAGAEVGQIRVANENRSYLPVEVCVPRSLGVDLAGSDDGAGMYLPVRLTVYPVPEASARNPTRPVYVATEIGFFNDKQEVEKTLRAEGAAEDHVRSAEVAFSRPQPVTAPVHAAPPQPADGRWWFEKVPAWAYGTAGLLFFAVFCVVAAVVVSLVRSSGRQKSRRRKNAEPDAEFEDEEPDAEEPEDRPRRG